MSGTAASQDRELEPIQLPRQAYPLDSGAESLQDLLNLYAEPEPKESRSAMILRSAPGNVLYYTAGTGPVVAIESLEQFHYLVSGAEAYRYNALTGELVLLGAVDNVAFATIAIGPSQVVICTPPNAYYATLAGSGSAIMLSQIVGIFPEVSSVAYLNGYFLFTVANAGQFFVSSLTGANVFNAFDFATQESMPDVVHRGITHLGCYWLFGTRAIEVWYNSGNLDFPFRRQAGAVIFNGATTPGSIAILDNGLVWLGRDGIVYQTTGFQANRISTFALEQEILPDVGGSGTASSVRGFSYTQEGHQFYVLSFPDAPSGRTWGV